MLLNTKSGIKLTKSAKGDEASHHERGMQVELLVWRVLGPGVPIPVVEHPEHGERRHADEQDGGQGDDQRILAPFARPPLVFIRFV